MIRGDDFMQLLFNHLIDIELLFYSSQCWHDPGTNIQQIPLYVDSAFLSVWGLLWEEIPMSCVFVQLSQHKYSFLQNMCTMQSWPSHVSWLKASTCAKAHLSNENKNKPAMSTSLENRAASTVACFLAMGSKHQRSLSVPSASFICWSYCNYILFSNIFKCSSRFGLLF